MGDWTKPIIAMHCFENLVQFINLHKYATDAFALQWRSLLLNVMLSGIQHLEGVKEKHLKAHFKLDSRTLHKYQTELPVDQLTFPQIPKKAPSNCWEKRPGGNELIASTKKYWNEHLVTSPKKNDLVFKHVRGDGKHIIVEINGLKEIACAPGCLLLFISLFVCTIVLDLTVVFAIRWHTFNGGCLFRFRMSISPEGFSHTSSEHLVLNVSPGFSSLSWYRYGVLV